MVHISELSWSRIKHPSEVVKVGDTVEKNQTLVTIEAMKMETPVKAPQDGTVATVDVAKGESVDSGKVLVTLN